jgi:hypothetical protein
MKLEEGHKIKHSKCHNHRFLNSKTIAHRLQNHDNINSSRKFKTVAESYQALGYCKRTIDIFIEKKDNYRKCANPPEYTCKTIYMYIV